MDDMVSRQAAIDHWRDIIDATDESDKYNMGFVDGLEFCISHLSTMPPAQPEPCEDIRLMCGECDAWNQYKRKEPCEDAVSRQAALECLEWHYPDALPVTKIKELPSVKPERPNGEWITDDLSGIIYCGRCGNAAPMETTGGGQYKSNFCPTCGADMRV